jgi:hypothetical protein
VRALILIFLIDALIIIIITATTSITTTNTITYNEKLTELSHVVFHFKKQSLALYIHLDKIQ